ncbi:MAG: hypothetical protein V4621_00790 [Pseudomonadota bacterium]
MQSPLALMQLTRALAEDSTHTTFKIAATLRGQDPQGLPFVISRTNFCPCAFESLPANTYFGDSSTSIHAETAVIFNSARTEGADLYVTDPICPDCMKNVITAGIRAAYIDTSGYAKPYARRAGHTFIEMSHVMAHHAGIPVYMVDCAAGQITCLNDLRDDATAILPAQQTTALGPILTHGEERNFAAHVLHLQDRWPDQDFATAQAVNAASQIVFLTVTPDIIAGHAGDPSVIMEGKHNYIQRPLMRLLLTAKRMGLRLIMDTVTCSDLPSSRDMVNFIGIGGRQIRILNTKKSRDAHAVAAFDLLRSGNFLTFL